MSRQLSSRRSFLKHATIGAVTCAIAGSAKAASANEDVVVGLIGCGGRGEGLATLFSGTKNAKIAYVCDPSESRAAACASRLGLPSNKIVTDLRRVLDDRSVDAVVVATPDHWHAPAGIMACEAEKHVYVEKPCAHNFREGQLLVDAARRYHRVVQHGTQARSSAFMSDAVQMLRDGLIGDVLVAKAWNVQRRAEIGHGKPSEPPVGFDYEAWIGPAPMVPYQENRSGLYNWRWWRAFGCGDMGNDGVHNLDAAVWGLGVNRHPSRIVALGGKYFFDDDQEFPDTLTVTYEYPVNGRQQRPQMLIFEMRLWSTNYPFNADGGVEFCGTKGKMLLSGRGKLEVLDEQNKIVKKLRASESAYNHTNHQADFVQAIRESRSPNAEIEIGFRSAALCHLGHVALQQQTTICFDPDQETILNNSNAQRLLSRDYREGGHWAIPKNV